ncbi:BTB and MATH domain-containing protein 38-like [Clytia hemisphaerica]|uniref:BTB domain-containing protein n=1 Tax=Clytia hemisphaerica TaxID=252671 RepID=A0A7M5WWG5_9CNID
MDFSTPWKNTDQILIVEGEEFHVHRCMLSLWSQVFDRMFHSHFMEKTSERIELKMKKKNEVRGMLEVMYDRTKQITDENFQFLLELADEYQIEELKHQCVQYLNKADKMGIKSTKYLATVYRFNLTKTVEACIKEIASVPIGVMEKDTGYQELWDDLKNKILTTRLRNLESETNNQKTIMNSFSKYLYETANEGFCRILREQGLEETVFSRCPLEENHKDKLIGQNFDINCKTCRTRVMQLPKQLTVESKFIHHFMEQIVNTTECDDRDLFQGLTKEFDKL